MTAAMLIYPPVEFSIRFYGVVSCLKGASEQFHDYTQLGLLTCDHLESIRHQDIRGQMVNRAAHHEMTITWM
jgi:hypothetical protein